MVLQESKKQRAQAKEVSTIYTVESECNKPAVSQRYNSQGNGCKENRTKKKSKDRHKITLRDQN